MSVTDALFYVVFILALAAAYLLGSWLCATVSKWLEWPRWVFQLLLPFVIFPLSIVAALGEMKLLFRLLDWCAGSRQR